MHGRARPRGAPEAEGQWLCEPPIRHAACSQVSQDHAKGIGDPLRYRGLVVPFDKIVLLRIEHVSTGSLHPILGVWDTNR